MFAMLKLKMQLLFLKKTKGYNNEEEEMVMAMIKEKQAKQQKSNILTLADVEQDKEWKKRNGIDILSFDYGDEVVLEETKQQEVKATSIDGCGSNKGKSNDKVCDSVYQVENQVMFTSCYGNQKNKKKQVKCQVNSTTPSSSTILSHI